MDAYKISIKLFAERDELGHSDFVPVFQRWIQNNVLPEHLLIDVADYAHVPAGPGTVLVSSQANLYTDRGENRLGLLYTRKLPLEGDFRQRVTTVLSSTLKAALLLEEEPSLAGKLKFRTDELLIRINDRLLAPNTVETFDEIKADVKALGELVYGSSAVRIEYKPSALRLFEVTVKGEGSPGVGKMSERLSGALAGR
jgi:hypothetical protein